MTKQEARAMRNGFTTKLIDSAHGFHVAIRGLMAAIHGFHSALDKCKIIKKEKIMIEKISREDIEMEILENDDLYEIFDEERLLSGTYTDDELRKIVHEWILDNDECEHI